MKSAPEKDWKAFKRIRARALDRFARRRLKTCRALLDEGDADVVDQWVAEMGGPALGQRKETRLA